MSANTISCYLRDVREFTEWYKSKTDYGLEKVIELDAVKYKKHLLKSGQAVITLNRKLAGVNAFLRWMKESGYITTDICIKQIKDQDTPKYKGLEERQLWKIRNEIHRSGNLMHICIIEILIGTGLRVSELTNIKLKDLDISERKGSVEIIGKGNLKRTVPLNKDVRKAISNYLEVRRKSESDHLLIGQRGALNRNAINIILQNYGKRVRIEVTPHMLRHTLGYNLVKRNVPITTIQQILGHENIATTNLYTITPEKDMIEALEGIEW